MRLVGLLLIFTVSFLRGEEQADTAKPADQLVETLHQLQIEGKTLSYKATTGTLLLKDAEQKPKASLFFVAYTKEGELNLADRPITFCFNGGPGASAVFLHIGAFGPRIVKLDWPGFDSPPYGLQDNPATLLTTTDLVFIDPVSTGYSRAGSGVDAKQFYGVEEDVALVSDFIRLYTTRYERWESPKFIAGESYGGTRAALLGEYLHDKFGMYTNGIILISSVLNFQAVFDVMQGNDLPYILSLPAFTAAAWYHKKLVPDLQARSLESLIAESERFAMGRYASVLLKGSSASEEEQAAIAKKMAHYTGLSEEYITRSNLRVPYQRFNVELLRDQGKIIGRFDGRMVSENPDLNASRARYDPSEEATNGAITAGFYQYVSKELNWKSDDQYFLIGDVRPWNYGPAKNTYLNVGPNLRNTMIQNPALKVFVANGYYDLAVSYFANQYIFDHLGLPAGYLDRVTLINYPSGHMMYLDPEQLKQLNQNILDFIQKSMK